MAKLPASKALQDYASDHDNAESILLLFKARELDTCLTARDYALLKLCGSKPVDVEALDAKDAHTLLWLVFYRLIKLWVDEHDRVWLRTTLAGRELLKEAP